MFIYSVAIRIGFPASKKDFMRSDREFICVQWLGTASTILTLPYVRFDRTSTSADVSLTQSSPVIPISWAPASTRFGISCGLSTFRFISGSLIHGR